MPSEAAENLKGFLSSTYGYLADGEPLKQTILPIIDGISDRSLTAPNIFAFAQTFRDALPNLELKNEVTRPILLDYHREILELIPELEAEARNAP